MESGRKSAGVVRMLTEQVIKDIHRGGNELPNQLCMTALQKMAGLLESVTKEKKEAGY